MNHKNAIVPRHNKPYNFRRQHKSWCIVLSGNRSFHFRLTLQRFA